MVVYFSLLRYNEYMIKNGLKNFFSCLRYYLTPLGIFAIALVIAFSVALPGLIKAPKELFDGVSQILNTPANWDMFFDHILNKLGEFDWRNDLAGALNTILNKSWLGTTLLEAVKAAFSESGDVTEEMINLIGQCIQGILFNIIMGLVILLVGFIAGYIILKMQIKRNIAKGKLKKVFIGTVIKILIDLVLMGLGAWLTILWSWNIIFFVIIFILANGFGSLVEAYIVYNDDVIKFKEVVNFKNFFLMYVTNLIIYAIGIGVTLGIALLINNFVGVFLGLPLLEITLLVVGLNAESYVKEKADEKENIAMLAQMMAETQPMTDEQLDELAGDKKPEEEPKEEKSAEEQPKVEEAPVEEEQHEELPEDHN